MSGAKEQLGFGGEIKEVNLGPKSVKIPSEWDVRKLDELTRNSGNYGANVSASEYDPGKPRYIRITDIGEDGFLKDDDRKSISPEEAEGYYVSPGDLLFARTGATAGKSYLCRENDRNAAYAGYLIRFELNESEVNAEFLAQYVQSKLYDDWVDRITRHGAQQNINAGEYRGLQILYPTLPEQRRIADILSTVDEQIWKTDKIIEKMRVLKKGVMRDLLTNGIGHENFKEMIIGPKRSTLPVDWDVVQLGDIADIQSGSTPKRSEEKYWDGGTIPWLKSGEFNDGVVEHTEEKITEKALEETGCVVFPEKTLVIALYGKGTVSKTARLGLDAATNQAIAGLLPKTGDFDPRYLQYSLINARNTLLNVTVNPSSDTGRTNIYMSALRQFKVALPPLDEQKLIAERISAIEDKISDEREYKEHLQQLKRGLMQDLLTGKVRVNADN